MRRIIATPLIALAAQGGWVAIGAASPAPAESAAMASASAVRHQAIR